MGIETLADVFEEQERINRKKRNLSRRDDQTAADWLALADEYLQIDSRANYAYCMSKCISMPEVTGETVDTEKDEWWQK